MELTGKIIAVLPERSGTSQRTGSEWKVATYVLETPGEYARKMAFEVFGSDRIAMLNIQMGETLTVSFDIDAHEYNGKWFNSIRAFRVDRGNAQPAAQPTAQPAMGAAQPFAPTQQPTMAPMGDDEQLPF
ncbi:MAG: DUF3127 domain-containing protein [Bacteroidaceae bacterium]|nr:DUF3127 domain-containing protein [Bacteroidaceae bacterium]